jgi:hypothetical protein
MVKHALVPNFAREVDWSIGVTILLFLMLLCADFSSLVRHKLILLAHLAELVGHDGEPSVQC